MMFRNYDGRTYSVFFEDADETMVCTGTKEDDNADVATPVPSTNAVRNENPYDEIPLFKPVECNGYADEDGELHITAVKGEPEFRTDGTKGDVCIALKTGYIRTIIDTVGIMGPLGKKGTKISVTDSWRESEYPGFPFIPYTAAIRPDGSVRPYVLIPKYQAVNFNSSYYSLPGFAPAYNVSHNGQITTFRKRGDQYCGETCSDAEIWETLFMIVFANMNSQAVMVGCTGFADQYMAAVAEENVERIILTKKQAEYFPIGCCVSIGEMGSSTNKDRGQSYMHNLANRVKVTKIEALDDDSGNYALYVDNGGVTFNTSTTTCISTMPWHTGSTDKVKGTCGSPCSNTNGKEPFKFLGIEFALGQYVVRSDVILNGVYDADADIYQQEIYTCYDCKYFATAINEHYKKLGYVIPDGYTESTVGKLNFDSVDKILEIANQYGLQMRGHVMQWHQQTSTRFFKEGYSSSGANVSKEVMDKRLEFYIRSVMKHVMDKEKSLTGKAGSLVYCWDITNEYTHRTNDPAATSWMDVYGNMGLKPTYVKKAYEIAYDELKQYGLQEDVTLFYNDYNEYDVADEIVELINYINEGEEAKICGGIGMQSHITVNYPSLEKYGTAVDKFLATGLQVQVTELDIGIEDGQTEEDLANHYSDIMKLLISRGITGVTVWGLYDTISWRKPTSCLLFGSGLDDPKAAFYSFIDAATK